MKTGNALTTASSIGRTRAARHRLRLIASTMLAARLPIVGAAMVSGMLAAPMVAQAQSVVLDGDYIKIGVNGTTGTLGFGGSTTPGILYDGTGTATFNPSYDYLTPGSPFEGFVVNVGGTLLANNNAGTQATTTGTLTNYSGIAYAGTTFDNRAVWEGSYGSLFSITNDYYFNDASQQVSIRTTITALSDLTGIAFSRQLDPDAVAASGDSSVTNNIRGSGDVAATDLVYAEALVSKYVIGLYTGSSYTHNAAITGWTRDTASYLSGTDVGYGDNTIGLGFSIGDLLTGESAVIDYAYIFGTDISKAIADASGGRTNITGTSSAADVAAGNFNPVLSGGTITFDSDLALSTSLTVEGTGGTIDTGTSNAALSGAITGVGGLTKTGTGTLTLTGANSYTGGTTVEEGTLVGDTTSLQGAVANSGTVEFAQGSDGTYAGAMSGTGALVKTGAGTLTLTGANSYTGGTTVEAGTLVGDTTSLQGAVTNSGTVEFAQGSDGTYAGAMSGTGALVKTGSGTLTLTGANSYTGGTTVEAGTLVGDTTSLKGAVANSGTVEFAQGSDGTYAGAMSGTGALVKTGSGTLTLTGANSYTGGTTVEAGTLVGDTSSLKGAVANSGTVEFAQGTDGTYSGAMSGSGALVKTGAGTLTLTGANSYTGGTTVEAGTLVGDTTSLKGAVVNSGTVEFAQGSDGTYSGAMSGTGALVKSGAGTLTLTGANSYTGGTTVEAGTLVGDTTSLKGAVASSGTVEFAQGADGTYAGAMSGSGALVKTGAGTLTLTGANSYTGGTTVEAGTLVGDTSSLKGAVANSGTVEFAQGADGTYSGAMSGSGALVKTGSGTLTLTGANSYTGGTTVEAGTLVGDTSSLQGAVVNNGTVQFAQASDGTYSGAMSGTGSLFKTGEGTLTLTGANSYTGGTTVAAGRLVGNTDTLTGNIVNDAVLEFVQAVDGTFTGNLSGTGVLAKSGAGTLTLSGTVEGLSLDISAGRVIATGQSAIGSAGGALLLRNTTVFDAGADLDITQAVLFGTGGGAIDTGANTVRLSGGSSGNTCLVKRGSGTLILDSVASNDIGACVEQGQMSFDSVFTGSVFVDAGGTAKGNGLVQGDVTVDGTLAPGNSPGRLVVAGSVSQAAGSTLAIDIDGATAGIGAGHYDTLVLTGARSVYTAGGTLAPKLRGITGDATNAFTPTIGQTFEIVTAEGGVEGSFDGLAQPTDGLAANTRLDVIYGANNIVLAVTPDRYAAWLAGAGGGNATEVAGAIDAIRPAAGVRTTGTAGTLFGSLATLTGGQLATSFQQLAGGVHADAVESQLQANQAVRDTMVQRVQARGVATGAGQRSNSVWGAFTAQRVDVDGDWTGNGYRATSYGYTIGADRQATDHVVIGVAASYKDVDTTVSALGTAKVKSYGGALYAVWNQGGSYLSGVVDFNVDDYKVRRSVQLGGGVESLKGDVAGFSYGADVEAGHRFDLGAVGVTPVAGIAYDRVERDAFAETGGASTALRFDGEGRNAWTARAGVRIDGMAKAGATAIRPYVSAMAVEQLGAARTMLRANLADAGFNTRSVSLGRTQLRGEAGLSASLSQTVSIDLRYRYTGLGNADAHSGNAAISLRW
ncbi:autotransporter-associated beta strand repeat-containing protein [Sphingomonas sp. RS6]